MYWNVNCMCKYNGILVCLEIFFFECSCLYDECLFKENKIFFINKF